MTADEVRHRPILTILLGPAAGVAGALMYEKLLPTALRLVALLPIFLALKAASYGQIRRSWWPSKTYLSSLMRTVGGGGSMAQISDGKAGWGPRSAHIANLDYEVYTDAEKL